MSPLLRSCLLVVPVLTSGCGPGRPAIRDAEAVVMQAVGSPSPSRIEVAAFRKTDGRSAELAGVALYSLMFTADARFLTDALYALDGRSSGHATSLSTSEYVDRSRTFSWGDALNDIQGRRPARRGDVLHLVGEVTFERRESGWIATGLSFTVRHDSTTRAAVSENPALSTSGVQSATPELHGEELTPGKAVGRIRRLSSGALCVGDYALTDWAWTTETKYELSDADPSSGMRTLWVGPGKDGAHSEWIVHPDSAAPLRDRMSIMGQTNFKAPPDAYYRKEVPEHLVFRRERAERCAR